MASAPCRTPGRIWCEVDEPQPGGVASAEAFAAYELLADLARSIGLDSKYEVVPPPGVADLNRPNLIVLTNPRLLPFLSQVMGADPHLGYAVDDQGWYLLDKTTGTEYRSPMDQGEAARFISDNIVELHRELKNRRFSTIVASDFDPKDRKKITSTKSVTPIYRPESS